MSAERAITASEAPSVRRLLAGVSESPTQSEAQAGLRSVLADPTLELLYWRDPDEGYVTADGSAVGLRPVGKGRARNPLPPPQRPRGAPRPHSPLAEIPAFP